MVPVTDAGISTGAFWGAASSAMDSTWCLMCSFREAGKEKKICNRLMVIQWGWNVIIKALWGAENSMNKTFQGEQPTLSVPPHYFTYLQPKQAKLPPPSRFLAVVETRSSSSTVRLVFLFFRGVCEWVGWCWPGWRRRKRRVTLTSDQCPPVKVDG